MIVAFTGHRPNKLGGYFEPNPVAIRVKKFLREELEKLNPDRAITGMAQGGREQEKNCRWPAEPPSEPVFSPEVGPSSHSPGDTGF